MGLSRMVDHIKPLLRPKSDQQFSHSLGTEQTVNLSPKITSPITQTNTFNPCFCTTVSSFSDNPLGRFTPLSHFCTVETLVFR
ncbi:hypothetical protein PEC730217_41900 [Pectobacterium carotovorum subsp. carotovorum]|nr:hypothetical protein PEC730217_41900 [Pectobacterium carotovorum subsp. carotovorum]